MAITLNNNDITYRVPGSRARAAAWLTEVVRRQGRRPGEIAVVFCSEEALLEINRKYLGHDYLTDVITFDYSSDMPDGTVSGDVYISVGTVADNAVTYHVSAIQEMLRVMAHGVLHLCGHKDATITERKAMRRAEDECLALYETLR